MFKRNIEPSDIEGLPLVAFKGTVKIIDSPGWEYLKAISYLSRQKMIGFDTETRPCFEPGGRHNPVALLQLSGADKAFLFRVNKIGMRRKLCEILSNPDIIKIGAATKDDIHGLQYYSKFAGRGFIDLQEIVWEWGISDKSVKKMAANIMGYRISKAQQLSNWEAETLSDAQKAYASTDAWVCLEMYKRLLITPKNPLTAEQMAQPNQNPAKNNDK